MTRRLALQPLLLAATALLAGCVTVHVLPLGQREYSAVSADSVRVFATQAPSRYTEIAVLKVDRYAAGDERVLRRLRERAASLGANGILLVNLRQRAPRSSGGIAEAIAIGAAVGAASSSGGVVVVGGERDADEFGRVVAIRWSGTVESAPEPRSAVP